MKNIKNWDQFNDINNYDVNDVLTEKILSDMQKDYRKYFKEMLDIYGVESQAKLSKEEQKEFYKNIRTYWIKGKGPKYTGEDLIKVINKKIK